MLNIHIYMCVYRYLQLCFPGAQLGSPCGLPVTKDRVTLPCGSTEMPHHELNCSSPRPRSHGARTAPTGTPYTPHTPYPRSSRQRAAQASLARPCPSRSSRDASRPPRSPRGLAPPPGLPAHLRPPLQLRAWPRGRPTAKGRIRAAAAPASASGTAP